MNKSRILLASLLFVSSSAFAQKLSPSTSLMLQDMSTQKRVKSATVKKVDAFLTLAPSSHNTSVDDCLSRLESLGVEVRNVVTGRLLTVSLPLTAVEAVAALDEVESVLLMSGGYDLLVLVEAKSLKELALFVSSKLSTLEMVTGTQTSFVLKRYKEEGVIFDGSQSDNRLVVSP